MNPNMLISSGAGVLASIDVDGFLLSQEFLGVFANFISSILITLADGFFALRLGVTG